MANRPETATEPEVGTPIADLNTPVVLIDIETMSANIDTYVEFAREQGIDLRSHVKTHKNTEIARLQDERSGSGGIVCQTLGEAETMARHGLSDIYLSYIAVGKRNLERAVRLSEALEQFSTTVDGPANIRPLQTAAAGRDCTVDVVLEIDLGLNRTGVALGEPAVDLAREITEAPNLHFHGVLGYEAHVKATAETEREYEQQCQAAMETLRETVEAIEADVAPVEEVKVGGTATSLFSGTHPVVTEINPGMYPFNDVGELEHRPFAVGKEDCAATVLTRVISKPAADRAIVDAGSKTFSLDKPQLPVPKHRDDIEYVNASEEHGWLDVSGADDIEIGDRLEFVVPHVCTTINLHDLIVGVRDGRVEERWSVHARGSVQ